MKYCNKDIVTLYNNVCWIFYFAWFSYFYLPSSLNLFYGYKILLCSSDLISKKSLYMQRSLYKRVKFIIFLRSATTLCLEWVTLSIILFLKVHRSIYIATNFIIQYAKSLYRPVDTQTDNNVINLLYNQFVSIPVKNFIKTAIQFAVPLNPLYRYHTSNINSC